MTNTDTNIHKTQLTLCLCVLVYIYQEKLHKENEQRLCVPMGTVSVNLP